MKVYCCRPMAGHSYSDIAYHYNNLKDIFDDVGIEMLNPMCGKSYLKNEKEFRSTGYTQPLSTNHAIFTRDRWMVKQSDVVFVNLLGCKKVSIGSMFEMAWAVADGKHIVLVIDKNDNIHEHAFVLESAHVIYHEENEAIDYLITLNKGEI